MAQEEIKKSYWITRKNYERFLNNDMAPFGSYASTRQEDYEIEVEVVFKVPYRTIEITESELKQVLIDNGYSMNHQGIISALFNN